MSRTPTKQQQSCIEALTGGKHNMLKVEACAGSGKTSTLTMMAEAYEAPSLYLAFNKVTATEASQKFPTWVRCQTTHSRAYATFGAKLAHKLSRPKGRYVNVAGTGAEISRYYSIDSYENSQGVTVTGPYMGLLVRETVARFEQSADEKIEAKHVPTGELRVKLKEHQQSISYVVNTVKKFAERLWAERSNLSSPVLATHDTYLKLFQLSKPVFTGVEVLYVDEFQDTTPCVLDIILNQKGKMKIVMVGDARQAIYGWRGAVNAMQMVDCHSEWLTKSFRYGQAVADIATTVLEDAMHIEGNEKIQSAAAQWETVDRSQPYTRLFRTNAALLYAAVEEIAAGTEVSIEIDVKDFVKLLQSAVALYQGDMKGVKHDSLLPYASWDEMVAESTGNAELTRLCRIMKDGLAQRFMDILESHVNSSTPAVTFTTAHKSKGREWEQVTLEDDFKSCYDEEGDWTGLTTEEQNLLYVAVTRAILRLEYNETVQQYINYKESSDLPVNVRKAVMGVIGDSHHGSSFPVGDLRGDMAQFYVQQEMEAYQVESLAGAPWE